MRLFISLLLLLFVAAPAAAIIIDGDETGTDVAPADDPGWSHVGRIGFLTGVYLGDGWVLTAHHVATNWILLDGVQYYAVTGSEVRISNPDGSPTDLKLYRIQDSPDLPLLKLSSTPAQVGEDVIMIGFGRERGEPWDSVEPPDCPEDDRDGWKWKSEKAMRWGTNQVRLTDLMDGAGAGGVLVHYFTLRSDRGQPTPKEALAANGDSGGAVFAKRAGEWELLGIIFAASSVNVGRDSVSLLAKPGARCGGVSWDEFGTLVAQISTYRAQIQERIRPRAATSSPGTVALFAAVVIVACLPAAAHARRTFRS